MRDGGHHQGRAEGPDRADPRRPEVDAACRRGGLRGPRPRGTTPSRRRRPRCSTASWTSPGRRASSGFPGLYVTGDPGAVDDAAKEGSLSIRIGLGWAKSHSFATGQCPVMRYHRGLMQMILNDRGPYRGRRQRDRDHARRGAAGLQGLRLRRRQEVRPQPERPDTRLTREPLSRGSHRHRLQASRRCAGPGAMSPLASCSCSRSAHASCRW